MPEIKGQVILHLTATNSGGAGNYTMDLHHNMLALGCESYVAVRGKEVIYPDGSVHAIKATKSFWWNKLRRYLFRQIVKHVAIDNAYSMYNLYERFTCHSAADTLVAMPVMPDVVFVHWVSDYANAEFISELKQLTDAKIVINFIDQAPLTGGCHYHGECKQYVAGCKNCPASKSTLIKHGIRRNFKFKKQHLFDNIVLMGDPSEDECIAKSPLYQHYRYIKTYAIIDEKIFYPTDKKLAKQTWGIPASKKVILFGCSNLTEPRKGISYLIEALKYIKRDDSVLLVLGKQVPKEIEGMQSIIAGYVDIPKLISAYQAADVFVCPTLADTGPLMVHQAIMCGTPVVAFPVGVSIDLVKTDETGYLATYADAVDLAAGIKYILDLKEEEYIAMSKNCRNEGMQLFAQTKSYSSLDNIFNRIFRE